MKIIRSHLDYIQSTIAEVDSAINTMVTKLENLIAFLQTVPGINRNSAIKIISEISTDTEQFGSSKRLCCWAGLTPGNNESAARKNRFALHVPKYISSLRSRNLHTQP